MLKIKPNSAEVGDAATVVAAVRLRHRFLSLCDVTAAWLVVWLVDDVELVVFEVTLSTTVEASSTVDVFVVSFLVTVVVIIVLVVTVVEDAVDVSVVVIGGHPSLENPFAMVSPSGQQPNAVMLQVMRTGQPWASGPAAGVWPSAQQPYAVSYNKITSDISCNSYLSLPSYISVWFLCNLVELAAIAQFAQLPGINKTIRRVVPDIFVGIQHTVLDSSF